MKHNSSTVEQTIYNTVRYFDLFDQPVTAVQLWQWQLGAEQPSSLAVSRSAAEKSVVTGALETRDGWYFLPGRSELPHTWLRRHALAQQKWKLTRRIVWWLKYMPFVRMIAMSGSLAAGNTRVTSDLDLFVIARAKRIWLARLGLLVVTEILGRRRRHWDRSAPDKVCLNHYVTDDSLCVVPAIRNVYTAVLYRSLISLTGHPWREQFLAVNTAWIKEYAGGNAGIDVPTRHAVAIGSLGQMIRNTLEAIACEPLFDWLEIAAEYMQRLVILRHTRPERAGRIVINNHELAFHPDTKVPSLLARYYRG